MDPYIVNMTITRSRRTVAAAQAGRSVILVSTIERDGPVSIENIEIAADSDHNRNHDLYNLAAGLLAAIDVEDVGE